MIAVTGATGALGTLVINQLVAKNADHNTLALVRDINKASALPVSDIQVKEADYTNPSSLEKALQGVTTLLLISSNAIGSRVPQHQAVIDAAKSAGVKTLVYTSVLRASDNPMILAAEHKPTEAYLKESGLDYVILRNGWYTENYTSSVASVVENTAVFSAAGQGVLHTAERNDYAEAAANVLLNPTVHIGNTYELAGDTGWTLTEYAEEISKLTGKSILVHHHSEEQQCQFLQNIGLPEGFAKALADSERYTAEGWLEEKSGTLSKLLGRPTTGLRESLQKQL